MKKKVLFVIESLGLGGRKKPYDFIKSFGLF